MIHTKEKVKPPRSLRTARLSVVKNKISTPVQLTANQNASVVSTPKKVIKALYDYQAQSPLELSFTRGDFFHVTGRENDTHWYEACNPVTNTRGVVPVSYFQVLEKNERGAQGNDSPSSMPPLVSTTTAATAISFGQQQQETNFDEFQQGGGKKMQPLYGIVLYDFQAERSDELDAKAGEPIIVIAQSNEEWFVAKPIGRLGGPGLIPVSFVEIRDAVTGRTINNVGDLMQTSAAPIPKVEEWKKMTQGFDTTTNTSSLIDNLSPTTSSVSSTGKSDHHHHQQQQYTGVQQHNASDVLTTNKNPMVINACMDSYILEGDQFWFIVYAGLSNGRHRVLYRLYEDFYDFQINLLHEFPVEAGKEDQERILPYMPGPLTHVDEQVTAERQNDLDKYCQELLALPPYLSECYLVQNQLFGIHEGDVETDQDPRTDSNSDNRRPEITTTTTPSLLEEPQPTISQSTQKGGTIKVKIIHKDDIIAIKMPISSTFGDLRSKICDRLGASVNLQYKSESTKDLLPLETESDMEEAFAMSIKVGKLTVYANDVLE
ncbi:hypothetical protein BC941DRAFT_507949 [Chlamydoabsidia padenii]|nr:hypothetical protein BC941DRAFT_507949 [Chlamydoabsidia padenii]